ncbi:MAG: hypothetical protein KJ697_01690 [Nanoarchaeota archaeon]|nr:hypothetical protein [Nanoarchaeota archaeon]MBU4124261.1 hypothetical protein [Nanoarchaeota archaeon]
MKENIKDKLLMPEVVLRHSDKGFKLKPRQDNAFVIDMILDGFDLS